MADIKEILKDGMRFGGVRLVHPKQIDGAANQLIQAGTISRETLERMGRDIANNRLLFKDVDLDQVNKMLNI
jgi:hypothetical protein